MFGATHSPLSLAQQLEALGHTHAQLMSEMQQQHRATHQLTQDQQEELRRQGEELGRVQEEIFLLRQQATSYASAEEMEVLIERTNKLQQRLLQINGTYTIHAKASHITASGNVTFNVNQNAAPISEQELQMFEQGLRNYYRSPAESLILLDVGDEKRELRVDELFVNLAIVEEETQRLQEQRALEQENQRLQPHGLAEDVERGPMGIGLFSAGLMSLGLMTAVRDTGRHQKELYDNESIYSPKVTIKPEDLFVGRTLRGGQHVTPRELVLLGKAGIGKTTLCRFLAYGWATNGLWSKSGGLSPRWVFYLRLKEVANHRQLTNEDQIHRILYRMLWDKCGVIETRSESMWLTVYKQPEKIIFILDGYDEVSEHRSTPCEALMSVRKHYSEKIQVLTTSRPHAQISKHADMVLENIGFTNEEIPKYIEKYFGWQHQSMTVAENPLVGSLTQFLALRPKIQQICHVPINLELLCSIWSERQSKLETEDLVMSDLYQLMLGKLMRRYLKKTLSEHDWNELQRQANPHRTMMMHSNSQTALKFLEELALAGFTTGNLILTRDIFETLEKKYSNEVTKTNEFTQAIQHFLNAGFLKAVGNISADVYHKEYYFIHLSFQEYLTARYFAKRFLVGSLTKEDYAFFQKEKYNPRYQLVWTYVAGIIRTQEEEWSLDSDITAGNKRTERGLRRFFEALLAKPRDLYGVYELDLLVRCGEEAKWPENSTTHALLEYLGQWVMGIARLHEGQDREHLLRHLNQLFLACPLAMAKVKYQGKEQLFNFLTFQAVMPAWVNTFVNTSRFLMDIDKGFWPTLPEVLCKPVVISCEAVGENCCDPICDNCCKPMCENCCETVCEPIYDNCCESNTKSAKEPSTSQCCVAIAISKCMVNLIETVDNSATLKCLLRTLLCPIGAAGGAVIGVLFVVGGTLFLFFEFLPVMLFTVLTAIVVNLAANFYYYPHYQKLQQATGDLLKLFNFNDLQMVRRLMKLLLAADEETCIRLIRSFEVANFSDAVQPLVGHTLHRLLFRPELAVQHAAWRRFVQFQKQTGMFQEEALQLFNATLYHACFKLSLWASYENVMEILHFLDELYPSEVVQAARTSVSLIRAAQFQLLWQRMSLRGQNAQSPDAWLQDPEFNQIHTQDALRAHFCLVCLTLLRRQNLASKQLENLLIALLRWQAEVAESDGKRQILYRQAIGYALPSPSDQEILSTHLLYSKAGESAASEKSTEESTKNEEERRTEKADHSTPNAQANQTTQHALASVTVLRTTTDPAKIINVLSSISTEKLQQLLQENPEALLANIRSFIGNLEHLKIFSQQEITDFANDLQVIARLTEHNLPNTISQLQLLSFNEKQSVLTEGQRSLANIKQRSKALNAEEMKALKDNLINILKNKLVIACEKTLFEVCLKAGLNCAYWSSVKRDLVLIALPVLCMYAPPLAYLYLTYGYRSFITQLVVACILVTEGIYACLNTWKKQSDINLNDPFIEMMLSALNLFSRSFAGILFISIYFPIALCGWIIILLTDLAVSPNENGPNDIIDKCPYLAYPFLPVLSHMTKFSWYPWLNSIDALEEHFTQSVYFEALLKRYPGYLQGTLFNSATALPDILRRHLAPHHTALWQKADGTFAWYQGRKLLEFSCDSPAKLKSDIQSIRLISQKFSMPFFSCENPCNKKSVRKTAHGAINDSLTVTQETTNEIETMAEDNQRLIVERWENSVRFFGDDSETQPTFIRTIQKASMDSNADIENQDSRLSRNVRLQNIVSERPILPQRMMR